ncbi:MAG: FadR/GntR family transcriptional regulator, partial [Nannocystaceae bacterium]
MALQKIARNSVSDAVYEQLSREILEGRMQPGDTLPAERALCSMLGVNRGAIREALKRLGQAGLVEIRHGGGSKVLDFRSSAGTDLLSGLLLRSDGGVDYEVGRSVIEMRAALGPDVARLCALRRSEELVAQIEARVEIMARDAGDVEALQEHDIEFWQLLIEGAENIAYRLAYNSLRATYDHLRGLLARALADEVSDLSGHRALLDAIRDGDGPRAEASARALLATGTEAVLALIQWLEALPSTDPDDETSPS